MQLIDLSGEIFHKCPTLLNHPPVTIVDFQTHDTIREAEGVKFSCASKFITFPLKIRGGTGSPVRAVAVIGE
jgi:kynurenine formamidase